MFLKLNVSKQSSITLFTLLSLARVSLSLPPYTGRNDFSELTKSLFDTVQLVEHYAAAAYCPDNTAGPNTTTRIACAKSNNCQKVESALTSIVVRMNDSPLTDATGFVATDATNNLTVISFQGTESSKQVKADLNLNLLDISHVCSGCTSHTGFWQSWNETRQLVIQAISDSRKKFPNNKIIVTGHSLGGAIATLAAAELRSTKVPLDLYTFGAPRVGNQMLVDYIQTPKERLGENYRVTHYNDPVPHLPPPTMGYAHYTPEIYISAKNQKVVALRDIQIIDDSASSKGNDQYKVLDVAAHRWYFNAISGCYMANKPSNGSTNATDLATTWASTVVGLMGNNSGIILVGATAENTAAASFMAGLLASMSTNAAHAFLGMIPGGNLAQPFLPSAATVGGLTTTGVAGLLSTIEALFGYGAKKSSPNFIVDIEP